MIEKFTYRFLSDTFLKVFFIIWRQQRHSVKMELEFTAKVNDLSVSSRGGKFKRTVVSTEFLGVKKLGTEKVTHSVTSLSPLNPFTGR